MDTIIQLLQDKNNHLEKFYKINESELLNFTEGNFENIEHFYKARETILDIIHRIDELIEQGQEDFDQTKIADTDKKSVLNALSIKNDLVTRILSQDLQILSAIEKAKSNIIRELAQVKGARKAVGGYRTKSRSNRLDEEA